MSCGIYKITSPNGRVYIGQSIDVQRRWKQYKYNNYDGTSSLLLFKSLIKYGNEQHSFEIIEECGADQLDNREIFWISYYKCNSKRYPTLKGLNLTDGGNKPPSRPLGYKLSEEAKSKISRKAIERHARGEYLPVHIKRRKPKPEKQSRPPKKVKMLLSSEERSKLQSVRQFEYYKTHVVSDKTRMKMSDSHKKRVTPEIRQYYSEKFTGRAAPWKEGKQDSDLIERRMNSIRKPIIQLTITGEFVNRWASIKDAEIDKFNSDLISLVCRKLKPHYRGYLWLYENEYMDLQRKAC